LWKTCKFMGCDALSKQLCCKSLTCVGPARWACAGCDNPTNSSWKHGG
jgi:hypothetical protein